MKRHIIRIALIFTFFSHTLIFSHENDKAEIREYFDDILLIINFNHPHYGNIEFLKEIYSPVFPNIVFYGEHPHPEVNVVKSYTGWFAHRILKDALIKYPGYKGYICTQDDCFVGFWNFPGLDKNKIWFHMHWLASLDSPNHWWPWWETGCGYAAVSQAYRKLPQVYLDQLEDTCGPNHVAFSWADFFYLPALYKDKYLAICDCFDHPSVFLEISIPTLLFCLEKEQNMEMLRVFWGGTGHDADFNKYNPSLHWIHPIKFSSQSSRDFVRNIISNQIVD